MERLSKILLFLGVALLIDIIYSCCGGTYKFKWNEISIKNLDNSGLNPVETDSKQINKNAYGIRITFQEEQIAYQVVPSMITSAMATSCDDDFIYMDTIKYIKVLANNDFDEQHLIGNDLSELFKGKIAFHRNYSDDLPKDLNQVVMDLNDNGYDHISTFDLYLLYEPKLDSTYCFSVEIGLSDKRVLSAITDTVILK